MTTYYKCESYDSTIHRAPHQVCVQGKENPKIYSLKRKTLDNKL